MRLYSSLNSRPSRISHSISDGVNGRGTKEVACLGFGEEVEPKSEGFLPVAFEGFAMFAPEILAGFGLQCKDLAPAASAQGRRQDDAPASRLDVAPQVCQRSAETDVIVHQDVELAGRDGSGEGGLERQTVEAVRARVANRVGLNHLTRNGETEAPPELMRHGVGDEVNAFNLDGPHGDEDGSSIVTAGELIEPGHRCF